MSAWVAPRAIRRAVIDPLWLPLAMILAGVFALAGILGILAWPLDPRRRLPRLCALALVYLWVDCGLLLRCFATWLRHPRAGRDPALWSIRHCELLSAALSAVLDAARRLVGFEIVIEPAVVVPPPGRRLIVLARHAGPGDSFALVQLLLRAFGRHPRVVLKSSLRWDPGLDVVLSRLGSCFLPSPAPGTQTTPAELEQLAGRLDTTDALLLFPEGGNWTPRRWRSAIRHLLRTGHRAQARAALRQPSVLPPRSSGTLTCLIASPDADVLIIAHAGLDHLVSIGQLWRAIPIRNRPMRISWWTCPAADVPREPDTAQAWLQEQWDKLAERVDALHANQA